MKEKNNVRKTTCPFCEKKSERLLYEIENKENLNQDSFLLYKCKICGLAFIQNPLPEEKIIHLNRKRFSSLFQKIKNKKILDFILSTIDRGPILHVECGSGYFISKLKKYGLDAIGIYSGEKKRFNKSFETSDIYNYSLNNFFHYKNEFTTIAFLDSLNFSSNPEKDISKAAKFTNENGYIVIEEKIFDNYSEKSLKSYIIGCEVPKKTWFFNPKIINKIMREKGFKVEKIKRFFPWSYAGCIKGFSLLLKKRFGIKNFFIKLPILSIFFVISPFINLFYYLKNYFKYGVFGNNYLAIYSKSKNR